MSRRSARNCLDEAANQWMMMSFHLPPTAASAAVNGQPLTAFRRRVRRVVTARFLLVATTSVRYDGENVTTSIMQRLRRAPATVGGELEGGVHTIMIIEMRTYRTQPGKRDEFLRIFRTKSVPAHLEIGMKILGPFLSVEDPDVFFFMRGFQICRHVSRCGRDSTKANSGRSSSKAFCCPCWRSMTSFSSTTPQTSSSSDAEIRR